MRRSQNAFNGSLSGSHGDSQQFITIESHSITTRIKAVNE